MNKKNKFFNKQSTLGEPPATIKWVIWFSEIDNWRKYWKSILAGLIFIFLLSLLPLIIKQLTSEPKSIPQIKKPERIYSLPENQIRPEITKALRDGNIERAMSLVNSLIETSDKYEECERLFSVLLNKKNFDQALHVIDMCWNGTEKKKKTTRLDNERLKY